MGRDNLAYAVVGIIIWISAWYLSDLLFGQKSRETQIKIYVGFLVAGVILFFMLDRYHGHTFFGKAPK
jgi:membrane protein DedA with SNARE-associated domain